MHRKPRSTQRRKHNYSDGFVPRGPTAHNPHVPAATPEAGLTEHPSGSNSPTHFGPRVDRTGEDNKRLSNITNERARAAPHRLSRRFTKFITNMHGQVKVPHNLLSPDRYSSGAQEDAERCLDVGQVPED